MHEALHQLAEGASTPAPPSDVPVPPAPLAVEHVYILRRWKGGTEGLDFLRRLRVDGGLQLYLVDGCGLKLEDVLPLTRDSALKLTTARYYTPSGRSVQEGGIEPDIRVPQLSDPDAARRAQFSLRESDLRGHLVNEVDLEDEALEADRNDDPRFTLTAAQLEEQGIDDFQLDYAIRTLRRTSGAVVARRN